MVLTVNDLPAVNALLNSTSAILLLAGFAAILKRRIFAHKVCMVSAFVVSTGFLVSYLYYHQQVGVVRFQQTGWIRPVYFIILFSHTVLAAVIVPLVLITLGRALRARYEEHRRIAVWTLPIWLYVSITGVVVYWMLYRL